MAALDARVCDRARLARDPRFDGRFFIAVLSTGIYCRPICPSPTARRENVRYFRSAEEAALRKRAEQWRPWRAYAAFYLWRAAADLARERAAGATRPTPGPPRIAAG